MEQDRKHCGAPDDRGSELPTDGNGSWATGQTSVPSGRDVKISRRSPPTARFGYRRCRCECPAELARPAISSPSRRAPKLGLCMPAKVSFPAPNLRAASARPGHERSSGSSSKFWGFIALRWQLSGGILRRGQAQPGHQQPMTQRTKGWHRAQTLIGALAPTLAPGGRSEVGRTRTAPRSSSVHPGVLETSP